MAYNILQSTRQQVKDCFSFLGTTQEWEGGYFRDIQNLSVCVYCQMKLVSPATTIESKLQAVRIFLNTALFDKIERDKEGKMPINQVIEKLVAYF